MARTGSRNPRQREADLVEVARYYCQGKTQAWIANELGLSQSQICYDLKKLHARWAEQFANLAEVKERELAKIDELERTYWDAWIRSCETSEVERRKKSGTPDNARLEVTQETREQVGDPRFLAGVERCIKMRRDMLGLDEPQRVQINWRQEIEKTGLKASDVFEKLVSTITGYIAESD